VLSAVVAAECSSMLEVLAVPAQCFSSDSMSCRHTAAKTHF
jgi:hypothetical protein